MREKDEKPTSTLQSFVLAEDTQAEEESAKEEVVLVNNDVDLLVVGDELHIETDSKVFAVRGATSIFKGDNYCTIMRKVSHMVSMFWLLTDTSNS